MTTDSVRKQVSAEEWQQRVDLAACYRMIARMGWDDLVFTHLTAKVPGPEHHFLINPYGLMFDEVTASNLVKVDLEGNKVMDSPHKVNPAGFLIHSTVHQARTDAKCVLHVHTVDGIAVSIQEGGLLPISQQALVVLSTTCYHDYEGIALIDAERERLVADLGADNHYMILRNHGILTLGETVADAFLRLYTLQCACQIQIRAQAGGGKLIPVPQKLFEDVGSRIDEVTAGAFGGICWDAVLRKMDRLDSSYKE